MEGGDKKKDNDGGCKKERSIGSIWLCLARVREGELEKRNGG